MRFASKKITIAIISLFSISLMSGCTDWKKEYDKLMVANQNLQGRLDTANKTNDEYANRINQDSQTIKDLQNQIQVNKKTPAQVSMFL